MDKERLKLTEEEKKTVIKERRRIQENRDDADWLAAYDNCYDDNVDSDWKF